MASVQRFQEAIQAGGGNVAQSRSHLLGGGVGEEEVAAVGHFAGEHPILGGVFERIEIGVAGVAAAEPRDRFDDVQRMPRFHRGPALGQGQAREGLPQGGGSRFAGVQGFRGEESLPAGFGIVRPDRLFAGRDVSERHFTRQFPGPAMPLGEQRLQQAVRVLGPPLLERLFRLSQCQPRGKTHDEQR